MFIVVSLLAGQYISYDFKWGISQTEGSSPNNRAAVVLIDGSECSLLV